LHTPNTTERRWLSGHVKQSVATDASAACCGCEVPCLKTRYVFRRDWRMSICQKTLTCLRSLAGFAPARGDCWPAQLGARTRVILLARVDGDRALPAETAPSQVPFSSPPQSESTSACAGSTRAGLEVRCRASAAPWQCLGALVVASSQTCVDQTTF
jgi:hypothetical protein